MKPAIFTFLSLFLSAPLLSQAPANKLVITHLTGDYYVFTTYNVYKGGLVPANGLYLLTDQGAALFDSPWDTTQFQPLLDSIMQRHHKKVVFCLATHSHEDRTAGLEYYRAQGAKTYTTLQTDKISRDKKGKRAEFLLAQDTVFTLGQHTFQTCYGGPGHTEDNIVVWFPREKILYGGCLIKSTEAEDLGYIGEANLEAWPITIRSLQKKFPNPRYIIPGHGDWHSKKALRHTLTLLRQHPKKK